MPETLDKRYELDLETLSVHCDKLVPHNTRLRVVKVFFCQSVAQSCGDAIWMLEQDRQDCFLRS